MSIFNMQCSSLKIMTSNLDTVKIKITLFGSVDATHYNTHYTFMLYDAMKWTHVCIFQAVELSEFKREIHEYVESRMTFIAPNLSIIVGASCAAKIMGRSS